MTNLADMPEPIRGEGEESEPVPLVVYIYGHRYVIGKAGITASGMIVAKIDQEIPEAIRKILSVVRGEFSFQLPRMNLSPFARQLVHAAATEDPFALFEEELTQIDDGETHDN